MFSSSAISKELIAFIDLDQLLKESDRGLKIYNDLDIKKSVEIEKIKKKENHIKKLEEEINKKRNVLTNDELKNEIDNLKKEINNFNTFKNQIQNDFEKIKKNMISEFFAEVNPLIKEYLDKNSIDILLNNKYVVIGKNDLDITETIIKIINKKLN